MNKDNLLYIPIPHNYWEIGESHIFPAPFCKVDFYKIKVEIIPFFWGIVFAPVVSLN